MGEGRGGGLESSKRLVACGLWLAVCCLIVGADPCVRPMGAWFVVRGDEMASGSWLVACRNTMLSFRPSTGRGGFQTLPYVSAFTRQRQQNIGFSSGMDPGSRPACPASSGESRKAAYVL